MMDPFMNKIYTIITNIEEEDGVFSILYQNNEWSVGCQWGRDENNFYGATAYGKDRDLDTALQQLLNDTKWT